jgi:hypothetical protein
VPRVAVRPRRIVAFAPYNPEAVTSDPRFFVRNL